MHATEETKSVMSHIILIFQTLQMPGKTCFGQLHSLLRKIVTFNQEDL